MSGAPESRYPESRYDVAVVGGGPVGSVVALAHAQQGARVVLLEGNPKSAERLAGEWLHPAAVDALRRLGVDVTERLGGFQTGEGFVIFPEDGSPPIELPYADGMRGFSYEHASLVKTLREVAASSETVHYMPETRVTEVTDGRLTASARSGGGQIMIEAPRIVGADGRASVVRAALGLPMRHESVSRMAGLILERVELPFEGFGHVFLGAPGPILVYRIGPDRVRLIADLPLDGHTREGRTAYLWERYGPVLPEPLRSAFGTALNSDNVQLAANTLCPRSRYGHGGLVLAGDSVGHYNPITALGMTFGFEDATVLARSQATSAYERRRRSDCRVPELIAIGIYESFRRDDSAALAIRHAIFDMWRRDPRERERTMRYLACQDGRLGPFSVSFAKVVGGGLGTLAWSALARQRWRDSSWAMGEVLRHTAGWSGTAILHRRFPSLESKSVKGGRAAGGDARSSTPTKEVHSDPSLALQRGVRALVSRQAPDGSWEGEVVWCPMLAAQYALMCHITGTHMPEDRPNRLLRHFERTRLASGLWGLHEHAEPSLFVTALVYVAARLLGVERTSPLLRQAAEFITGEGGITAIPSWGKFWLALLGLYEWEGVHPVLPEAWVLPRGFPLHPRHFYCHTRMIYMGMAAIYGRKPQAPITPVIESLRNELYPHGYHNVDFRAARWQLRPDDLYKPPGTALKLIYRLAALVERLHIKRARRTVVSSLEQRIRWELQSSDHTSISPVSGLLNIIALWLADPADPDLTRALQQFEGWLWEDEEDGARVAGARSASWDTAFAVQALAAAKDHAAVVGPAERGSDFLATQQIRHTFDGYRDADRIDPNGGWCFAGVWHGWPVSDCTAEAVLALAKASDTDPEQLYDGVRFILRCQNRDGGFGSYEPRRLRFDLERINPAEMFGDSMSETSWVECTASCLAALAEVRKRDPGPIPGAINNEAVPAMARAVQWLRTRQQGDGSWPGTWGVHFIYGTMFGIVGLLASGAPPVDPDIRRACAWLKERQRRDGGWGEHFTSNLRGEYVEHSESQVIQSAWALRALLAAEDPDWRAIERGAQFLAAMQREDGIWPKQEMAGVFFHTALLDYELYRRYFPVWALALYETRRKARLPFAEREVSKTRQAGIALGALTPSPVVGRGLERG